jgi:predicted CoA-binding protein
VVNVVTPPAVTLDVLKQVAALGLPNVFLQDGSYDDAVLEYAAEAPFRTVFDACIMVVTNRLG